MKKFLPFVFPAIALLFVLFLAYRWYNNKTNRPEGQVPEFAQGVQIEDLTQAEMNNLRAPVKDLNTVKMEGEGETNGDIRYDIKDGKISFSVMANLPPLTGGKYQVWLQEVNGDAKRKAFVLTESKGGWMGSAAISQDTLPFEVVVSKEVIEDDKMESALLRGILRKEEQSSKSNE